LHRLKDPFKDYKINLKLLRDNLLDCRASKSIVIAWGVSDGGRLGIDIEKESGPQTMMKQLNNNKTDEQSDVESAELHIVAPTRVYIPTTNNVIKVSCGNTHTLALIDDGLVFSWGINNKGCLGLPQEDKNNKPINYRTPQLIVKDTYGVAFNSMKDIATGATHSMALSFENRTFSWGNGEGGRLGHGTERSEAIPKEIESLVPIQPKAIFSGGVHSACISIKNHLYTWGKGSYGRLGLGFTNNALNPELVEELCSVKVNDVVCGAYHTFAICSDKNVYAWGGCNFGKLGFRGKNSGNLILPTPIPSLTNKKIIEICAGAYHTLCINSKGSLYAWGNGSHGKLGIEVHGCKDVPTLVDQDTKYGSLKYRNYQEYLNKVKHDEFLRDNDFLDEDSIKKDDLFKHYDEGYKVLPNKESTKSLELIQIGTCEKQTLFLSNSGELFGCGASDNHILDTVTDIKKGEDENKANNLDFLPEDLQDACKSFMNQNDIVDPSPISIFTGTSEHRVSYLSCGSKHVVCITQKNEAFSWGNNSRGQLGLGNIEDKYVAKPRLIKMFETVKLAACGDMHSLLLANSGIVYFCAT
jgi:alpha-tubulin suppressor-like RCC1 family protein